MIRKKRTLLIVDHECKDNVGHHMEYLFRIGSKAKSIGYKVRYGINRGCSMTREDDLVERAFTYGCWEIEKDFLGYIKSRMWGKRIKRPQSLLIFRSEVERLIKSAELCRGDSVFFATVSIAELYALTLDEAFSLLSINVFVLLRREIFRSHGLLDIKGFVYNVIGLTVVLKARILLGNRRVKVLCDTEPLCKAYRYWLGKDIGLLLPPVSTTRMSQWRNDEKVLRVGVLGGLREEKGGKFISDIVSMSSIETSGCVEFLVQCTKEEFIKIKSAVRLDVSLTWLDVGVSTDCYAQAFDRCDVILLPYERKKYKKRSSGVFTEAVARGLPVVFPKGLWLEMGGSELEVMSFERLHDIPLIIANIQEDYEKYRVSALRARELYLAQQDSCTIAKYLE